MDYQQKYLKYKSKYLEKKYGHIQIFSYKIDNNNDLDYKQKYLKYKSKYLNIKYGGAGPAKPTPVAASKAPVAAATPAAAPAATPAAASTSLFSKIGNLAKSAGTMISNLTSKPTFIADAMKAHMLRNQNDKSNDPGIRNDYIKNNLIIFSKKNLLTDIQSESTKHPEIAEAIKIVLSKYKLENCQTYLENLVISYNAEKAKKAEKDKKKK